MKGGGKAGTYVLLELHGGRREEEWSKRREGGRLDEEGGREDEEGGV